MTICIAINVFILKNGYLHCNKYDNFEKLKVCITIKK